jgi:hypothetical protein
MEVVKVLGEICKQQGYVTPDRDNGIRQCKASADARCCCGPTKPCGHSMHHQDWQCSPLVYAA